MEREGLFLCSQELASDPYPEPDESNPHCNENILREYKKTEYQNCFTWTV
jgi:hypothetical protein